MKRLLLIFLISFIFIVSCQKTENSFADLKIDQNKKQLLFFSDEKNIQNEDAYYDALLEIKKDYPHIVSNMTVISSSDNRDLGKFEVDTFPALMVVYKNQILLKLKGKMNKDDIIKPISKVLSKDSK